MELQTGQLYVNRNGDAVEIVKTNLPDPSYPVLAVVFYAEGGWLPISLTKFGRHKVRGASGLDLMEHVSATGFMHG